jgi:hypothetical protein
VIKHASHEPALFGNVSHLDPIYQWWGYQLTEIGMMWHILHGFSPKSWSFYSTDGDSSRHNSQSYAMIFMCLVSWLGFRSVHASSQFLLHISLLSTFNSGCVLRCIAWWYSWSTQCLGIEIKVWGESKILKNKYDHDSHGTHFRDWLSWRDSAAILNYGPILSSERKPHINKPATIWHKYNLLMGPRWVPGTS